MISIKHIAGCIRGSGAFSFQKDLFGSTSAPGPLSVVKQLHGLFCYRLTGVPGVDQRWSALPEDGKNYCVPAASMNWFYYLGLPPDPANGSLTVMNLLALGLQMGIDPEEGTGFDDGIDALIAWLDQRNASAAVLGVSLAVDDDLSIRVEHLRAWALGGGLVNVNVGSYKNEDGDFERKSGHRVTMVGIHQINDRNAIVVHDPGNDKTDLGTQSATTDQTVPLADVLAKIEGTFVTVPQWGGATSTRFIDGYVVIVPASALTNNESGAITYYEQSLKSGSVATRIFAVPFPGEIEDIAIHPGLPSAAIIGQQDNNVWMLDLPTGAWRRIATLRAPRRLTFAGRAHHLFALDQDDIVTINPEDESIRRVETRLRADAISYDPTANSIVVASVSSSKLLVLSTNLQARREYELTGTPLRGPVFLTIGPRDGAVILTEASANELRILRPQPSGIVSETTRRLAANRITAAAQVSRSGTLHTIEDGRIVAFDMDGKRVPAAVFVGLPAGTLLEMRRSHHNFDPRRAHLPRWRDAGSETPSRLCHLAPSVRCELFSERFLEVGLADGCMLPRFLDVAARTQSSNSSINP
jgi:hypothetical protein